MDTTAHTLRTRLVAFVLLVVSPFGLAADRSSPDGTALTIHAVDGADERAVDWAWRRFREGGLGGLPRLEVYVHSSEDPCKGGLGRYRAGRIDLCTNDSSEPYARKFALHEMAHAWTEANVDAETVERFMEVRGLTVWNDGRHPWKERGSEQVAEIIAWGLGEGEIAPLLPDVVDPATLATLYELVTGAAPITSAA
jgi:hypothetical protein